MRNEPLYIAPNQPFYNQSRSSQPVQFQRRYQTNGNSRNRNQARRASQTAQKKLDPITSQLAAMTQKKAEPVAAEDEESQEPKVTADASIEGITSSMEQIQVS